MPIIFTEEPDYLRTHLAVMRAAGFSRDVDRAIMAAFPAKARLLAAVDDARTTAHNLGAMLASPGVHDESFAPFVLSWNELVDSDPMSLLLAKGRFTDLQADAFVEAVQSGALKVVVIAYAVGEHPAMTPWSEGHLLHRLETEWPKISLIVLLEDGVTTCNWQDALASLHPAWAYEPAPPKGRRRVPVGFSLVPWPPRTKGRAGGSLRWTTPSGVDYLSLLVNRTRPLLVVGTPRSGKTTLLSFAVRDWMQGTGRKAWRLSLAGLAALPGAAEALASIVKPSARVQQWLILEDADRLGVGASNDSTAVAEILAAIRDLARQSLGSNGRFRLTVTMRPDEMRGQDAILRRLGQPPLEVQECRQALRRRAGAHRQGADAGEAMGMRLGEELELNLAIRMETEDDWAFARRKEALTALSCAILSGRGPSSPEQLDPHLRDTAWLTWDLSPTGQRMVRFRQAWMCEVLAIDALMQPGKYPLQDEVLDALAWRPVMLRLAHEAHGRRAPANWPPDLARAVQAHERRHWSGYRDYAELEKALGDTPDAYWVKAHRSYYMDADYTTAVGLLLPKATDVILANVNAGEGLGDPDLAVHAAGGPLAILVSCLQDLLLDAEALWLAGTLRRLLKEARVQGRDWHEIGGSLARLQMRRGEMTKSLPLLQAKQAYHQGRADLQDELARDANDLLLWHALDIRRRPKVDEEMGLRLLSMHEAAHREHDFLEERTGRSEARSRIFADRNLSYALAGLRAKDREPWARVLRDRIDLAIDEAREQVAGDPGRDPGPLGLMHHHRALDRLAQGLGEGGHEDARLATDRLLRGHYRLEAWLASRLLPGDQAHATWDKLGLSALETFLKIRCEVEEAMCLALRPRLNVASPVLALPDLPPGDQAWIKWASKHALI